MIDKNIPLFSNIFPIDTIWKTIENNFFSQPRVIINIFQLVEKEFDINFQTRIRSNPSLSLSLSTSLSTHP